MNNYKLRITIYELFCGKLLGFVLLLSSCSIFKHIPTKNIPIVNAEKNVELDSIVKIVSDNYPQFEWFSGKASTTSSIDGESYSFTSKIRIRKDSAIWISAGISAIEGGRILLTIDTVKFMNRLQNTYYVGSYQYLDSMLHAHLDFFTLQSILTTNFSNFISTPNYFNQDSISKTDKAFSLSFIRPITADNNIQDYHWILNFLNSFYHVNDLSIEEINYNRKLLVQYQNMQEVNTQYFPFNIDLHVIAEKNANISFSFDKIEIDKILEFPFKIPASYKLIK